jgi:hypothetical protein
VQVPEAGVHLFNLYNEIRKGVNESFGPARIDWNDFTAWQQVMKTILRIWEIKILMRLDDEYMTFKAKKSREK